MKEKGAAQFSHRLSLVGRVPTTAATFPHWMAKLSLCIRKALEQESPDSDANRPPLSEHRAWADGPQTPRVSTTTGVNEKLPEATSSAYLALFHLSAFSATDPAVDDENLR